MVRVIAYYHPYFFDISELIAKFAANNVSS